MLNRDTIKTALAVISIGVGLITYAITGDRETAEGVAGLTFIGLLALLIFYVFSLK